MYKLKVFHLLVTLIDNLIASLLQKSLLPFVVKVILAECHLFIKMCFCWWFFFGSFGGFFSYIFVFSELSLLVITTSRDVVTGVNIGCKVHSADHYAYYSEQIAQGEGDQSISKGFPQPQTLHLHFGY